MVNSEKSDTEQHTEENVIERDTALNIHQRIHGIMCDVGALVPDKKHPIFNKEKKKVGDFDYNSHDGVTAHIKSDFVKYGVLPIPTIVEHKLNGNRTELTVNTSFVNIDNPADQITVQTIGYGADSTDKGPGKALSYAVKSAYLKVLMLNSQEDTGEDAVEHDPAENRASELKDAQDSVKQAREVAAGNLKLAIEGCASTKELRLLKKDNQNTLDAFPDVTADYFNDLFASTESKLKAQEDAA